MPRLEVSKPIGVWSHQLLMNVNIDTRVFNLYMFIWVRFALLFRGGPVESTFSPESDQTAVGPDQSLWLSLLLVLLLGVCHRIFSSKPRILLSCLLLCHFTPVFRKQALVLWQFLLIKIASWCFSVQILLTVGISKEWYQTVNF